MRVFIDLELPLSVKVKYVTYQDELSLCILLGIQVTLKFARLTQR